LQGSSESQRAATWLRAMQNDDGGFGESCASYDDPALNGRTCSTASQTAWALIGLLAAGEASESAVRRAVDYLLEQQRSDGTWSESAFTGTGFPRVFYLKYHLYRNVFPLYALARYRNKLYGGPEFESMCIPSEELEFQNGNRSI